MPKFIKDTTWPHLEEVTELVKSEGYILTYTRPMHAPEPVPYYSCKFPSFHCQYILNDFQVIWKAGADREIYLNHGFPANFIDKISALLAGAGFTILDFNPTREVSALIQTEVTPDGTFYKMNVHDIKPTFYDVVECVIDPIEDGEYHVTMTDTSTDEVINKKYKSIHSAKHDIFCYFTRRYNYFQTFVKKEKTAA